MTIYNLIILVIYAAGAVISFSNKAALGWLLAGAAAYAVSVLYWRAGWPMPALFAGLCDAVICVLLYYYGRHVWESWVFVAFQAMVLVNFLFVLSRETGWNFADAYSMTIGLEVLNVILVLIIGGSVAWQMAGQTHVRAFEPWTSFYGFARPVLRVSRED